MSRIEFDVGSWWPGGDLHTAPISFLPRSAEMQKIATLIESLAQRRDLLNGLDTL